MRAILLILSAGVALMSVLTVVRAPDYVWTWKLAILIGEFGHWIVLLPLGLAVIAGISTQGVTRALTLVLCAGATVGLLRPLFGARQLAATLPVELRAALGPTNPAPVPFSYRRLYWGPGRPSGRVTTEIFARSDGQELTLDFYAPPFAKNTIQRPPCVVVIHGGGWDSGDRRQLPGLNYRLAGRGYAVAAISYRLAPRWRWPAQKEDTLAALAWLKQNAGRLGFDGSRLVLLGRSAGAQVAEVAAYATHDPAIRGLISFYGPSDVEFAYRNSAEDDAIKSPSLLRALLGGTPDQQPALYEDASALRFVTKDSPPTLMLHGSLDTLVWHQHDVRLSARLAEAGVPHYFLSLPWATHGFDFNLDGPGGQLADYAIDQFLGVVTK